MLRIIKRTTGNNYQPSWLFWVKTTPYGADLFLQILAPLEASCFEKYVTLRGDECPGKRYGGLYAGGGVLAIATRLNKIAIYGKSPHSKWTRKWTMKPLAYRESDILNICVTRPPEICVNLVFKHIHAASSYIICR